MKKLTLFALALLCALQTYAQGETETAKEQYVVSPIMSNWTISIGAGAELHPHRELIVNENLDVPTFLQFDISAAKWINPYVGLRLKYAYSPFDITSTSTMNIFVQDGATTASGSIHSLHGDVMFDLTSILRGYNEDRFYSLKPYLGIGFASVRASDIVAREFTPTWGIVNEFRLSKPLSLHVDLAMITPNAQIYGEKNPNPRFFTTSATVGLTYFFGRVKAREFKTVTTSAPYQSIARENATLSRDLAKVKKSNSALARDVDDLQKELEALKAQKANVVAVAPKTQFEIAPVATFFELNKSNVTKEDVARLKFVAAIMKEQPDVKFIIEGYADSATGSTKRNQELSKKRAEAVCNVLIDKYGVKASQLQAVGMGETDNLFDDMTLNRAVITKTIK